MRPLFALLALPLLAPPAGAQAPRPRARDIGLVIGVLPPGPLDAITDVAGVRVGQVTVTSGDSINSGVTAILPHGGNPFQEKVPAAVAVGNGFGKLTGIAQVRELGELESPIVLTCTLCVPRVADAVLTWLLGLPGNEGVQSVNVVVGETNDGYLNAIRQRPVTEAQVLEALRTAAAGPVEEGSVGAGRGTVASPLAEGQRTRPAQTVAGDAISPLFEAVVEATEEAVLNSLFRAETVHGRRGTVAALPVDSVVTILREHRVIP